jgi:hypothetical protein
MNKKILPVTIAAIILVAAGGFLFIKNQKAEVANQKEITNGKTPQASESTLTPTPSVKLAEKSDASTMVTKIAQITLTVSSPASNSTVTTSKVTVKGKTLPKAEVYANEAEGFADAGGNFSLPVTLDDGGNEIIVTAVDADGNVAETVVSVTYNSGE